MTKDKLTTKQVKAIISVLKNLRKEALFEILLKAEVGDSLVLEKGKLLDLIDKLLMNAEQEKLTNLKEIILKVFNNVNYRTSKKSLNDDGLYNIFVGNFSIYSTLEHTVNLNLKAAENILNQFFSFQLLEDIKRSNSYTIKEDTVHIELKCKITKEMKEDIFGYSKNKLQTQYCPVVYCFGKSNVGQEDSDIKLCFPKLYSLKINNEPIKFDGYIDNEFIRMRPIIDCITKKGNNYTIKMEFPKEEIGEYVIGVALYLYLNSEEKLKEICNKIFNEEEMKYKNLNILINVLKLKSLPLSLQCPISKKRIKHPIKGIHCKHVECFDADYFLKSIHNYSLENKCPLCSNIILHKKESYVYDTHFLSILRNYPNVNNVILDDRGNVAENSKNIQSNKVDTSKTHNFGDFNQVKKEYIPGFMNYSQSNCSPLPNKNICELLTPTKDTDKPNGPITDNQAQEFVDQIFGDKEGAEQDFLVGFSSFSENNIKPETVDLTLELESSPKENAINLEPKVDASPIICTNPDNKPKEPIQPNLKDVQTSKKNSSKSSNRNDKHYQNSRSSSSNPYNKDYRKDSKDYRYKDYKYNDERVYIKKERYNDHRRYRTIDERLGDRKPKESESRKKESESRKKENESRKKESESRKKENESRKKETEPRKKETGSTKKEIEPIKKEIETKKVGKKTYFD